MYEIEQHVTAVRRALAAPMDAARAAGRSAALRVLCHSAAPSAGELQSAGQAARAAARDVLLSLEVLGAFAPSFAHPTRLAALRLSFDALASPPTLPDLPMARSMRVVAVVLAAGLGATAGMLLLAPGLHWLLGMRDVGLLLGGVAGAPLGAWAAFAMARFAPLRWLLTAAQRGSDWTPLLDAVLADWCEHAALCLAVLTREPPEQSPASDDLDRLRKSLQQIGRALQTLQGAAADELRPVAEELLVAARLAGFDGLDGQPRFAGGGQDEPSRREITVWSAELSDRYELFGDAEPGDEVLIERAPVEFDGRVLSRGLARRKRNR